MRYEVGDEVYLSDDTFYEMHKDIPLEIKEVDKVRRVYHTGEMIYLTDYDIDHEKTDELQKKDKTLKHYQGELEKIVEQRNNDDYTKALMKYGRVEGDNLDAIKPKHYHRGLDDLIEGWYRTQPWNEWRTSMVNLAERYFRRDKNDPVEDIEKGIFVMNRVKEKEIERCET